MKSKLQSGSTAFAYVLSLLLLLAAAVFAAGASAGAGSAGMAFHSAAFLFFFFPVAFLLYHVLPGIRWKNRLLLVVSLVFYAFGQWQGLPLLLLSAFMNYIAGKLIARGAGRKPVLILALTLNLLGLGCFKYMNFFSDILSGLLSRPLPGADLLLPMGISFFTFKGMSYVIDVYRGGQPAKRFSDALLYISFFPQVTAGPITRYPWFAGQLEERTPTPEQTARGLRRFIIGLGKKLLISALTAPIASAAFSLGGELDVRTAWLGAAAYSVQIYFDFSGYSDMAIGLASVFGFSTPENFLYPYIASSITDFWRRWHISLSQWFRDYLYIPLGGGRRGSGRKALNKAVVFLLCGLWHGANWTFLLWGAWHGLFSALESLNVIDCKKLSRSAPGKVLCHGYTLLVVCLGFVIFRAADLSQVMEMFRALFTGFRLTPASTLAICRITPASWCALLSGCILCLPIAPELNAWAETLPAAPGRILRVCSFAGAAALFLLCLMAAAGGSFAPFIYAQF